MASLETLDRRMVPGAKWFVDYVRSQGIGMTVTSAKRSSAEQARLYQRYVNGQSHYPAAPPGTSTHEFGLAFDAVVSPPDYQSAVGELWEQFGGRWGGRFKDPVHFEFPGATAHASKARPRQTKTVTAATGKRRGAPDEPGLGDEGIGPAGLFVGKWWTGLVPGFDSLVRALSGG